MKNLNVELGLIIDLTYTTRYYDVKVIVIEYLKKYLMFCSVDFIANLETG